MGETGKTCLPVCSSLLSAIKKQCTVAEKEDSALHRRAIFSEFRKMSFIVGDSDDDDGLPL